MVSMNGNWLWGSGSSATSNYAGKMNLRQVGAKIEGEYSYPGFLGIQVSGKIEGSIDGYIVKGAFHETASGGSFEWTISQDETSFTGPYSGSWGKGVWFGKRP
jgi:hypothetical protein